MHTAISLQKTKDALFQWGKMLWQKTGVEPRLAVTKTLKINN